MSPNHMETMFQITATAEQYYKEYNKYLSQLLQDLDYKALEEVTQLILERSRNGQTVFFAGNGGSAATASHFALDLIECSQPEHGLYFRSISLANSTPLLTAFGNDKGYEEIFASQVRHYLRKGDILVAISASGNSPNIIAAVRQAKKLGGTTIGLAGFDGGTLAHICDYTIHVRTDQGEYGPVEDIHLILDHMITSYLRMTLREV